MSQIQRFMSRFQSLRQTSDDTSTPSRPDTNSPARTVRARLVESHNSSKPSRTTVPLGGKIGMHAFARASCIEWLRDLSARGGYFPVVKAVDDIDWLHEAKMVDDRITTIARLDIDGPIGSSLRGVETVRNGNYEQFVDALFEPIVRKLDSNRSLRNSVDYWEICHRPNPVGVEGWRKLAECMLACMVRADEEQIKLALFSTAAASPEWWQMEAMVETGVFGHALVGGHIMACHESADELEGQNWNSPITQWHGHPIPANEERSRWVQLRENGLFFFDYDPSDDSHPIFWNDGIAGTLMLRYRFLYELLRQRNEVIPLVISETHYGGGYRDVADTLLRMTWYDEHVADDYYVLAHLPFTIGGFRDGWSQQEYSFVWPSVTDYMERVRERNNARPLPSTGESGHSAELKLASMRESELARRSGERLDQQIIVNLLPVNASIDEKFQVLAATHNHHGDLVQSARLARRLVQQGLSASYVVVWDASRWSGNVEEFMHMGRVRTEVRDLAEPARREQLDALEAMPEAVVVNLTPPDCSLAERRLVAEKTHSRREAMVTSAEIAIALYKLGGKGSRINVWEPNRWQDDILHILRDENVWIETNSF